MTLQGIKAFGCTAVSAKHGLIVGGDHTTNGNQRAVLKVDRFTGSTEIIAQLQDNTVGMICSRPIALESLPGEKVVICTLGRTFSTVQTKTYVYYVNSGQFERKIDWDFPDSGAGPTPGIWVEHVIGNKLYVRTDFGVYEFRETEMSAETSTHWFKVPGDTWARGLSADFQLKYIEAQ